MSASAIRGDPMSPIIAIAVAAGLAASAPHGGTVTFHGAVVKGEAGGITGVDVPADQRRTTTTFGVSIRIVGGCDTQSLIGRKTSRCDPRTVAPRVIIDKGGPDVVVTTVYF